MKKYLVCCVVCATLTNVVATDKTWDGSGINNKWASAANWDADTLPAAGDVLFFGGATQLSNSNNLAANTAFNGINFNVGAGSFVLSTNAINLAGNITNNSLNLQTISLSVALQQDVVITTGAGITLSGVVSGAHSITKVGSGVLTLGGNNLFTGLILSEGTINNTSSNSGVLGNGNLTMSNNTRIVNSANALFVSVVPSGSGNVQIENGGTVTFEVQSAGARASTGGNNFVGNGTYGNGVTIVKAGLGTLNINQGNNLFGGTVANTYRVDAGLLEFSSDVRLGNPNNKLVLNGGGLYIADSTTLGGSRALILQGPNGIINVNTAKTFSINASGQISGTGGLNKTGGGQLTIGAPQSYTGGTFVTSGTLLLSGTGSVTGPVTVASGATLSSPGIFSNDLTLNGGATLGGAGSFRPVELSIIGDVSGGSFSAVGLGSTSFVKDGDLTLTLGNMEVGVYSLFSGGLLSGQFGSVVVNGFTLNPLGGGNFGGQSGQFLYTFANNTSTLSVVPEDPAWALLAFSGTIVMILRRRRIIR